MNFPQKETASYVTGLRPPAPATSPGTVVATSGLGLAGAGAVGYVLGRADQGEISVASASGLAAATLVVGIVLGLLVRRLLEARRWGDATVPPAVTCERNLRMQLDLLESIHRKGMNSFARSHAVALERDLVCVGLGWLSAHLADAVDPRAVTGRSPNHEPVEAVSPSLVFDYARELLRAGPSCSATLRAVAPPEM